jgi:hypothetical protein
MGDYDYHDDECPQCRHHPTHIRDCCECEEGAIDISDENFEVEGTSYMRCPVCKGKGIEHWCPKCGYDLILEK